MGEAFDPRSGADSIATSAGFTKNLLSADGFTLCSYARIQKPGDPLAVYIEGDGLAWKGSRQISEDPTPLHPLVLRLAAMDPAPNVLYLARPGQYLSGRSARDSNYHYWTDRRFSEEVIAAVNEAISGYAQSAHAPGIDLIGYSGGAAVAVLVADRRTDIRSIRTIAGNLDPGEVNRIHRVSPLADGPDPMAAAARLAMIPQRHFVGVLDKIVPVVIAERFKNASGAAPCMKITPVKDTAHQNGWLENWEKLLTLPVDCGNSD